MPEATDAGSYSTQYSLVLMDEEGVDDVDDPEQEEDSHLNTWHHLASLGITWHLFLLAALVLDKPLRT